MYPSPFTVDGINFPIAEHWMMAEKAKLFNDDKNYNLIIQSKHRNEAKNAGRMIKHFDAEIWEGNRSEIVIAGNLHKFKQNPSLGRYLIQTQKRILVEASPVDPIWGIGIAQLQGC